MGINLALGRTVTISETPHAVFPELPVSVIRTGDADWAFSAANMTDGQQADVVAGDSIGYVGFNTGTDITFLLDLTTAAVGNVIRASGFYGASSRTRPVQVKLESSDNGTTFTTVVDWDSLPDGGAPGATAWMAEIDISAAGSHRYWRLTLQRLSDFLLVDEMEFWT